MLKKFSVKNFKSFCDLFVFDLTDIKNFEFNSECIQDGIVKKAAIYGPNGCGKTNLIRAIFDIETHLTDKKPRETYTTNYLNATCNDKFAFFCYEFAFGKDTLIYTYKKRSHDDLLFEEITINGEVFLSHDRSVSSKFTTNLPGTENLKTDLGDSKLSAVKYVRNNSVFDDSDVNILFKKLFYFIDSMMFERIVDSHNKIKTDAGSISDLILSKDDQEKQNLLQMLQDFLNESGVECKLSSITLGEKEQLAFDFNGKKVDFFSIASTGTLTLIDHFLHYIVLSLHIHDCNEKEKGITPFIAVDEFDAFYHHEVALKVAKMIKRSECQMILTTHNTSIMTNDFLRPDCYFIMDNTHIKPLHRLTEKDLRKAHNIEKMYKAGSFNEE